MDDLRITDIVPIGYTEILHHAELPIDMLIDNG
jgi:hypothetical protein